MLHRHASSNDQKNNSIQNLFFQYARAARALHGCVKRQSSRVYLCGKDKIKIVSCERTSFACSYLPYGSACEKITSVCTDGEELVTVVTGCKCVD